MARSRRAPARTAARLAALPDPPLKLQAYPVTGSELQVYPDTPAELMVRTLAVFRPATATISAWNFDFKPK
jgi:hypothetical protein